MSFVGEPFRHDVFVSYSHGDPMGEGNSPLKQWSQSFVRELKAELQTELCGLNAAIDLFLDESPKLGSGVDRMSPLSDNLKTEIGGSAILSLLMTPQYLDSKWCRQELDWWVNAQLQHGIIHENRIAVAQVFPTGDRDLPQLLKGNADKEYIGVNFYSKTGELRGRPFGWPRVEVGEKGDFRLAVVGYAGMIMERLQEIRKELERRRRREEAVEKLRAGSGQIIYLHGRETQQETWSRVRHDLVSVGYSIFPLKPDPVDREPKKIRERAARRMDLMEKCHAILLLGENLNVLEEDLPSVGCFERREVIANSNRPLLPCAVVDTARVVDADLLVKQIAANIRVDWIDGSLSPWTHQVQAWLSEVAQ